MPLAVNQILQGRYRILRPLGQGGMGTVYLAEDLRLGSRCAIKERVPDPTANPHALAQMRQQFRLEAHTLAALSHPNLPKVTDFFTEGLNEYIVMEYVEGEDLAGLLARYNGPLPEQHVLTWADQVLDALDYLHSRQPNAVIHRDIKPANIILTPNGNVKLVDFGLVKLFDPANPYTATAMKGMGTPEYTPLEQYGKGAGHTDARSDIYAFGATLYHLLTAVAPTDAPQRTLNPASMIAPRRVNPALSASTEAAVLRALNLHPDQRFASAREMRSALQGPSAAPTQPAVGLPGQRTRHLPVALGIGAAAFVILVVLVVLLNGTRTTRGDEVSTGGMPLATDVLSGGVTPVPTPSHTRDATMVTLTVEAGATEEAARLAGTQTAVVTTIEAALTATADVETTAVARARAATATERAVARATADAAPLDPEEQAAYHQLLIEAGESAQVTATIAAAATQTAAAVATQSAAVRATAAANATAVMQATLAAHATATAQADATATAQSGAKVGRGVVFGRMILETTGQPMAELTVELGKCWRTDFCGSFRVVQKQSTDSAGYFRFTEMLPGRYEVVPSHCGTYWPEGMPVMIITSDEVIDLGDVIVTSCE